MQTQVKTFRRTLTYIAKSALILAGAVAVCVEWIPASIGDPGSNVAPAANAPGSAQRISPSPALRRMHESKAACPGCDARSTHRVRMSFVSRGTHRCAHRANPAAAVNSRVNQGSENADLLILLDWHMKASSGYGFGLERATCSAKMVAPMPLEASEAYEILARNRDEPDDAPAHFGGQAHEQANPAAALRQETD